MPGSITLILLAGKPPTGPVTYSPKNRVFGHYKKLRHTVEMPPIANSVVLASSGSLKIIAYIAFVVISRFCAPSSERSQTDVIDWP